MIAFLLEYHYESSYPLTASLGRFGTVSSALASFPTNSFVPPSIVPGLSKIENERAGTQTHKGK
jgi:hypothetical protein